MGWFDISTLKEPYRLEGKKTMGLELAEQFGWQLPDVILYPTGGGTGLIGMWKAFAELARARLARSRQAAADGRRADRRLRPIVRAFEARRAVRRAVRRTRRRSPAACACRRRSATS